MSGATRFDYNQPAWAHALVWGNQVTWGKALVWGNLNPVWDDPGLWANALVWGNMTLGVTDGTALVWGNREGLSPITAAWAPLPQQTQDMLGLANPDMQK